MADPRSSKIIGARLRAAATAPVSVHPDPDLLTAFAEHALNEKERAKVLEHLSQCGVCRDVVYFAQPEEPAAPLQVVKAPPQTHWFAWRRLQWAALAASLSVVAAVAVLLKENPSRLATPEQVKHEPSNSGTAANYEAGKPTSSATVSTVSGELAQKSDNDNSRKETAATKAPALQEKGRIGAGSGGAVSGEAFGFSRDDHAKTEAYFSDKEAKQNFKAGNETKKDVNGALALSTQDRLTEEDNKKLFDLRQQARGGPATANSNGMNYTVNGISNSNLDQRVYDHTASAPSTAPSAPPPPPSPKDMNGNGAAALRRELSEAEKPAAAAKAAAPATRAVVPPEEARNKKKLETIPSQPTPQATDETVAVAGQAQEVAGNRSASGTIQQESIQNAPLVGRDSVSMLTLSPGVVSVPASAATGWRVHQGQVQARISGSWHNVVVAGAQPASGGYMKKAEPGALSVDTAISVPPRFSSVSAVGSDIWAAESIGKDQAYVVVFHSHDGGANWQPSALSGSASLKADAQVNVRFKNAQQGRVSLSTGETWETRDGGAHWNLVK